MTFIGVETVSKIISEARKSFNKRNPSFHPVATALVNIEKMIHYVPVLEVTWCYQCKYAEKSTVLPLVVCTHQKGLVDPVLNSFCSYGISKEKKDE